MKIKVETMYDNQNGTWNVMDMDKNCLFFGTIDGLEAWLDENKKTHVEEKKVVLVDGSCRRNNINLQS